MPPLAGAGFLVRCRGWGLGTVSAYDSKSCSTLAKLYYKPIEAALRWCGLIEHEARILKETGAELFPPMTAFPQWPCLRQNAEKI